MRESTVEDYLKTRVKELRGETRKVKWLDRNGAPDRLVWIPKWKFPRLAEMKRPDKDLEAHQDREHVRLRRMGFVCAKLNTLEDVDRFLR